MRTIKPKRTNNTQRKMDFAAWQKAKALKEAEEANQKTTTSK